MSSRIAVIGGGWAGLTAAVELVQGCARVTLFEAAKQLGGRARSVELDGHRLDNGQHILIGAYHETLRLMRTVGADPEKRLKRLPLELNYPGSGFHLKLPQLPAPLNLAFGLLSARGCSLAEKISAASFMRKLQASHYQLTADCSVAELLDRHHQHGSLRLHMWEPLCLAALNTAPENASAQIFANVLRDSLGGVRSDTDLLLPATDLNQVFPDAAAEYIRVHQGEIRLATRIEALNADLSIDGQQFDGIILAVAPQHATHLLATHPETADIATMLDQYHYEPIGTVYAAYPPEVRLPCPMLGLDVATGGLGQWVFDRGALGKEVGVAPGLMGFVLSAQGAWDERESADLMTSLHQELETALGQKLPQPRWHQLIRERRATFSCRPDLPRPSAKTPLKGLWLAGDYVCANYPATLEGAVRSGITAARGIINDRPESQ